MSKPARGSKRVCPSCGARFYDLSRTPIVCPVCQSVYQVTPPAPSRRERAAPVEARKVVVEPEVEAPVLGGAEVISLEEVEEAGAEVPIEEDEEIVDIGDDGVEVPASATTRTPSSRKRKKARPTYRASSARRARRPNGQKPKARNQKPEAPATALAGAFSLNRLTSQPKSISEIMAATHPPALLASGF